MKPSTTNHSKPTTNKLMLRFLRQISEINKDILGMTKREFLNNSTVYRATITSINQISETTNYLQKTFKSEHNEIEWASIKRMRNNLTHEYYNTSPKIVWRFVNDTLPKLEKIATDYILSHNSLTRNELIKKQINPDCLPYLNQKLIEIENNILKNNNEIEMEI